MSSVDLSESQKDSKRERQNLESVGFCQIIWQICETWPVFSSFLDQQQKFPPSSLEHRKCLSPNDSFIQFVSNAGKQLLFICEFDFPTKNVSCKRKIFFQEVLGRWLPPNSPPKIRIEPNQTSPRQENSHPTNQKGAVLYTSHPPPLLSLKKQFPLVFHPTKFPKKKPTKIAPGLLGVQRHLLIPNGGAILDTSMVDSDIGFFSGMPWAT